jgi:site-specific DNA recombinase
MGYRYKDGRLIVKEDEAQKVRKIFQDYIRHRNLRKVARIHNLDAKKVQRIISNESYLGLVKWKGERIRGTHQPIIDSETFEKARKIMNERK